MSEYAGGTANIFAGGSSADEVYGCELNVYTNIGSVIDAPDS